MTTTNKNNPINFGLFLRTSNIFPRTNVGDLAFEMSKAFIDIANAVNNRTISIFTTNKQSETGESWYYFQNRRKQTLRKLYRFDAIAPGTELDIPIDIPSFTEFTRIWGTVVTDIPDYRPLPYVDPVVLTTGMGLLVGPIAGVNNVRIILGATAQPVVRGFVVLEWLN